MSLPTIPPAEAKRLFDQGAVLVDIREADEHPREKIPGARRLPPHGSNKPISRSPGKPVLFPSAAAGPRLRERRASCRQGRDLRRLHRRGGAGCLEESRIVCRDRPPPASRLAASGPDRRGFSRLWRDAARASRLALVPCRAAVCRRRAHPLRRDRLLRGEGRLLAQAPWNRAAYALKAVGPDRPMPVHLTSPSRS